MSQSKYSFSTYVDLPDGDDIYFDDEVIFELARSNPCPVRVFIMVI